MPLKTRDIHFAYVEFIDATRLFIDYFLFYRHEGCRMKLRIFGLHPTSFNLVHLSN